MITNEVVGMARAGRRPGQPETRAQILDAARALFADQGYDATTIRQIAAASGVNPALVHHYFGSKDRVFTEALAFPVDPVAVRMAIVEGPREQTGERLVSFFLGAWRDEEARQSFSALLRSLTTHEEAARVLREFLQRVMVGPLQQALGVRPELLEAMAAQLVGLAILRYIVRIEPLASATDEEIAAFVAPVIQRYVDPAPA